MKLGIIVFILLVEHLVVNCDIEKAKFPCADRVPYIENDCNECFCGIERVLACTAMACPTHTNDTYMNCEVDTTWTKGCNRCWCAEGLGTICTAYKC